MSVKILRALMQLFALIAKDDEVSSNSRSVVKLFLRQQLSFDQVEEYLQIFDGHIEELRKRSKSGKKRKRTSVSSVKVLKICTEINRELAQKQKFIVLVRLLEFIFSDSDVTDQELEFVDTVAETFNIPKEEYQCIYHFISPKNITLSSDSKNELVLSNEVMDNLPFHLQVKGLDAPIKVLRVEGAGMYFMRYFGDDELFLNGQVITPLRVYALNSGASIRSNKVQPVYYSDITGVFFSDSAENEISYQIKDLRYKFPKGNVGLHTLNHYEKSGNLIGIMGASGAGKSTLLNLMNGTIKPTEGEILINGINIHEHPDEIQGIIGYISQDDLLLEDLTVFQNLYYNAKLCFSSEPDEEVVQKVNDVLEAIGLLAIKDLKVGSPINKKISGGQRKRLNIALELIREPSVLFVDEPTSGLSSRDSENIMDLLNELAQKGKLIYVVIHQPSSEIFKMFDNLLILDTGGYPVYYGNPVDGVIYFKEAIKHVGANESECQTCGNVNTELIFNIIETKVVDEYGNMTSTRKMTPKAWFKLYQENIEPKLIQDAQKEPVKDKPKGSYKIPSFFKQLSVFVKRDVLSKVANVQYMLINFLEAPILAFILAFLVRFYDNTNNEGYVFRFNENIPAFLFMSVVVALFMGLTVSAEEIISDQKILKRERFLNLSKLGYLKSKILILFTISAIQTLTFVLVGNSILGIQDMYLPYWLVLFSTSCFANVLGLNISATFSSVKTIYIFIPIILIPQLLLSGVIVNFDKLNPSLAAQKVVPVTGELMTSRWAFEALATYQMMHNPYDRNFFKYDQISEEAAYISNYWTRELISRINQLKKAIKTNNGLSELQDTWDLVKNEIENEQYTKFLKIATFETNQLPSDVNKLELPLLNQLTKKIEEIEDVCVTIKNENLDNKNRIIYNAQKMGGESLIDLQFANSNESLYELVINKTEVNKIIEVDGELVRKANPIHHHSKGFRSHFFAPTKVVFGSRIETFWVNNIVIWIMSAILFVVLYFDGFLKLMDLFSRIFKRSTY